VRAAEITPVLVHAVAGTVALAAVVVATVALIATLVIATAIVAIPAALAVLALANQLPIAGGALMAAAVLVGLGAMSLHVWRNWGGPETPAEDA